MIETFEINWFWVAGNALWISGVALALSLITWTLYHQKTILKKGLITSGLLIFSGLIFTHLRIPHDQLIVSRIENPNNQPLKWQMKYEPLILTPQILDIDPQNKNEKINLKQRETINLFWDGFVRTPFIQFKKGLYTFQLRASGTRAENEFSKIKIEFEIPDENHYLFTQNKSYITLSSEMKEYFLNFEVKKETPGRIRITFFNDIYIEETNKGRDVQIAGVKIYLKQ